MTPKYLRVIILALGMLGPTAAPAQSVPEFVRKDINTPTARDFLLGRNVLVADYDGNGAPDVAVTTPGGITVLRNVAGGNSGAGFFVPVHTSYDARGLYSTADLNGDGRTDLIELGLWSAGGRILLSRGDGTFMPLADMPGLSFPAASADFNVDGKADLVHFDVRDTTSKVLLGNGDGTFRPPTSVQGPPFRPDEIAVADFNRDGRADVAARSSSTILVFLGRGDETFQAARETRGDALLVADFNKDGFPDIATRSDILLGSGDGSFRAPMRYVETSEAFSPPFAAADFNQDGHIDLVLGSRLSYPVGNQVFILAGKGDGQMSLPSPYTVGWGASTGAAADLDVDGRSDLVTANRISNTTSLLLTAEAGDRRSARAVSSGSGTAVVAPQSLATVYTSELGARKETAGAAPLPTELGGLSLEIRDSAGAARLAPLLYVSESQVNFLVPETTALGEARLYVLRGNERVQVGSLQVEALAPAVFHVNPVAMTPAAHYVQVGPNGIEESQPVFTCPQPDTCLAVPIDPTDSESYVTFLATGFGNATAGDVGATIRGQHLDVLHVSPHGTPGIVQIKVRIPTANYDFWELGGGDVVLTVGGVRANTSWLVFSKP